MKIEPNTLSLLILICSSVFVFAWYLDSLTHANIAKKDILDAELYTHRILILSSGLLQGCLLLFYWFDYEVLPFFIALFITRTIHEIIDEVKYHQARCTFRETLLHFVMWLSILSQVGFLFYWGFFFHYTGLSELPVAYFTWGTILVLLMALISWKEWFLAL
ncbi:MAG: hypothetical protein ACKOWX_04260 [Flavobacteriales bacterium]